ncbi:MAG: NAD-binding protein, partial [Myxococcota bacterium]
DAQTFFEIASNASGQNWSMTSYCPAPGPVPNAPSNRDYAAGFAVDMMLKDLRLASAAAQQAGVDTVFGARAMAAYESLSAQGQGNMDFSVIMRKISGDLPE